MDKKIDIKIEELIQKRISNLRLGLMAVKLEIRQSVGPFINYLEDRYRKVGQSMKLDEVNSIGNIALTRKAYKALGADPNRYRPSADALTRRLVKGNKLAMINNAVDALNYISVSSGLSISGFDLTKIRGDICMGIGEPGEEYLGIGRGEMNIAHLPVFRDDLGAFGTPTSDSVRTMITDTTDETLFILYDFGADPSLNEYMDNFFNLLKQHADAKELDIQVLNLAENM